MSCTQDCAGVIRVCYEAAAVCHLDTSSPSAVVVPAKGGAGRLKIRAANSTVFPNPISSPAYTHQLLAAYLCGVHAVCEHKHMRTGNMTQLRSACHDCTGVAYFVDGASPKKPPCGMGGTFKHKRARWGENQYCWPWLFVIGRKRWCLKPPSVCSASSMNCRDWHWYGLSSTARPCTLPLCRKHGIMQDTSAEAEPEKMKRSCCKRQCDVDLSSKKQFTANGCVTRHSILALTCNA